MKTIPQPPEPGEFWAEVLSADPIRVRKAFDRLAQADRDRVRDHLRRMATEEGWHPEQRSRARSALAALEGGPSGPEQEAA